MGRSDIDDSVGRTFDGDVNRTAINVALAGGNLLWKRRSHFNRRYASNSLNSKFIYSKEGKMILSEIHLIAEIFGAAFLVVSASIIIFELHQNLKQRKIHNTFMRSVEVEKIFHREMEKEFSILLCKAKKKLSELRGF